MDEGDQSMENQLLDRHPGVRELVSALPEFIRWRGRLAPVVVDNETFYVVGGDMLKDDDQVIVEWTRRFRPDLLSD
ncbi:hypothetical protein ASF98_21345 [Arthrobacter sp. Leaf337]|jgi:hypothetical protein|uniref:hypothetical protein n=1 Tax=Arthrobacter sp. Leaf337 TaxID=1736342 RepID=UPI0006F92E6C|nr:hypothetical protein [Arthrobacter sp. Leaf337]KQR77295.1 hypothetical protein ASF98_21345 [Arthrobacter sp. Leaf337]